MKPYTKNLLLSKKMSSNRLHPYAPHTNALIISFSMLLRTINVDQIDPDLARLYYLAHGGVEDIIAEEDAIYTDKYNKFCNEHMSDIRHWVYAGILVKLEAVKNIFTDTSAVKKNAMVEWDSSQEDDKVVDLGYTSHMPSGAIHQLNELLMYLDKHKDVDVMKSTRGCHHLRNHLERTVTTIFLNRNRSKDIVNQQMLDGRDRNWDTLQKDHLPIYDIVEPLCKYLPTADTIGVPASSDKFLGICDELFTKDRLLVYALIIELLARLRDPQQEASPSSGRLQEDFIYSMRDLVSEFTDIESGMRWVGALPSLRPEFVITIDDTKPYRYRTRLDTDVSRDKESLGYLRALLVLNEEISKD